MVSYLWFHRCSKLSAFPENRLKEKSVIPLSRREFVRRTGVFAAAYALPGTISAESLPAATLDPSKLKRFVDPLPIPEIAKPAGMRPDPANPAKKLPYYRMGMGEFESRVHRDLAPTRMWGFNNLSPGPVIEARSGNGVLV